MLTSFWRRPGRAWGLVLVAPAVAFACGSSPAGGTPAAAQDDSCAGPCPATLIKHVVVLVQENHTFDDHLGAWCQAPAGSNPSCTRGRACCEAMPATDPAGNRPTSLTDAAMAAYDPPHDSVCEAAEMDGNKMDAYATAPGGCGSPKNVAMADPATIAPLWALASAGAVADRYFQPIIGQSSANDMYLARAQYVFPDNSAAPAGAVGMTCDLESAPAQFTGKTIGDWLTGASVPWAFYAEGYAAMRASGGSCPARPADCTFPLPFYPCAFDPSDVPFEYYASTRDDPATMKDLAAFEDALDHGGLPAVSFIKAIGYRSEHPGYGTTLSAGVTFVTDLVHHVAQSRYQASTLVLLTYDEGGGYFDHVAPPGASAVDGKRYGTRVPLIAMGPFARAGTVSHAVLEHSSIVKFLEWNFLGRATGQLGGRDAEVENLGTLLDPSATGATVPER